MGDAVGEQDSHVTGGEVLRWEIGEGEGTEGASEG